MRYALVDKGLVVNLIWLHPANTADFPGAVPCGDVPVRIGDGYDGSCFVRDGQRILTHWEEAQMVIAQLDAALLDLQYQLLMGGVGE